MSIILPDAEEASFQTQDFKPSMNVEKLELEATGVFSSIFLDYLKEDDKLKKFYREFPTIENFRSIIAERNFPSQNRAILKEVLDFQYKDLICKEPVNTNLKRIADPNTFTVTTGHQLNIFSGPLYFIYKIVSCIKTTLELKKAYPDYQFVPVYWMASEDHDFEEINHFNLFGKKYTWSHEAKGAVGKIDPLSLKPVLDEIPEKIALFEKAYLTHNTLADATRFFVNELFGEEGLLIVDGDNAELKKLFAPVIKEELLHNESNKIINETSSELADLGYKVQVYPREINLFYMDQEIRERIVFDGKFKVMNTELAFSEKEILQLVEKSPEKFSPNVVLRPLYQEMILPNLAYIGGPAEVAYWFQLKKMFEFFKINFPIIMPRNFGLIINKNLSRKIKKLNLASKDLFLDLQLLKNKFILENSENSFTLEKEKEVLRQVFMSVMHKACALDHSLEGMVGAENAKALKSLENIEKRLRKAEEKNQEVSVSQIENIKEKLFPGGSLQERTENFLNFYINNPSIIRFFIHNFDPFDYKFHVIIENE